MRRSCRLLLAIPLLFSALRVVHCRDFDFKQDFYLRSSQTGKYVSVGEGGFLVANEDTPLSERFVFHYDGQSTLTTRFMDMVVREANAVIGREPDSEGNYPTLAELAAYPRPAFRDSLVSDLSTFHELNGTYQIHYGTGSQSRRMGVIKDGVMSTTSSKTLPMTFKLEPAGNWKQAFQPDLIKQENGIYSVRHTSNVQETTYLQCPEDSQDESAHLIFRDFKFMCGRKVGMRCGVQQLELSSSPDHLKFLSFKEHPSELAIQCPDGRFVGPQGYIYGVPYYHRVQRIQLRQAKDPWSTLHRLIRSDVRYAHAFLNAITRNLEGETLECDVQEGTIAFGTKAFHYIAAMQLLARNPNLSGISSSVSPISSRFEDDYEFMQDLIQRTCSKPLAYFGAKDVPLQLYNSQELQSVVTAIDALHERKLTLSPVQFDSSFLSVRATAFLYPTATFVLDDAAQNGLTLLGSAERDVPNKDFVGELYSDDMDFVEKVAILLYHLGRPSAKDCPKDVQQLLTSKTGYIIQVFAAALDRLRYDQDKMTVLLKEFFGASNAPSISYLQTLSPQELGAELFRNMCDLPQHLQRRGRLLGFASRPFASARVTRRSFHLLRCIGRAIRGIRGATRLLVRSALSTAQLASSSLAAESIPLLSTAAGAGVGAAGTTTTAVTTGSGVLVGAGLTVLGILGGVASAIFGGGGGSTRGGHSPAVNSHVAQTRGNPPSGPMAGISPVPKSVWVVVKDSGVDLDRYISNVVEPILREDNSESPFPLSRISLRYYFDQSRAAKGVSFVASKKAFDKVKSRLDKHEIAVKSVPFGAVINEHGSDFKKECEMKNEITSLPGDDGAFLKPTTGECFLVEVSRDSSVRTLSRRSPASRQKKYPIAGPLNGEDWNKRAILNTGNRDYPMTAPVLLNQNHPVDVYILDTGLINEFRELPVFHNAKMENGWAYTRERAFDMHPEPVGSASNRHGTRVASIVAQMAPHATTIPIRMSDNTNTENIFKCFEAIMELYVKRGRRRSVINYSGIPIQNRNIVDPEEAAAAAAAAAAEDVHHADPELMEFMQKMVGFVNSFRIPLVNSVNYKQMKMNKAYEIFYRQVLTVGGLDRDLMPRQNAMEVETSLDNTGKYILDIFSPGGLVYDDPAFKDFGVWSLESSIAAPHVASVIANILSSDEFPSFRTNEDLYKYLLDVATRGPDGNLIVFQPTVNCKANDQYVWSGEVGHYVCRAPAGRVLLHHPSADAEWISGTTGGK